MGNFRMSRNLLELRNLPKKKVKSFSISLLQLGRGLRRGLAVQQSLSIRLTALVSDITCRDHAWAPPEWPKQINKHFHKLCNCRGLRSAHSPRLPDALLQPSFN